KDHKCLINIKDKVRCEDFYSEQNGLIFRAMLEIDEAGEPIDYITLMERLRDRKEFNGIETGYLLTGLRDDCITTTNVDKYALIIREYATLRAKRIAGEKYKRGDKKAYEQIKVLEQSIKPAKTYNQSDKGNADLLVYLFQNVIRFNHTNGKWYLWNDQYWSIDNEDRIYEYVKKAMRIRQQTALKITDISMREKEVKFAIRSENHTNILSCINSAKSNPKISTTSDKWDTDPYLLQFENGVLHLTTKEFTDGNPELLISQSVGFDYNPSAECPLWERTIAEIFNNNQELVSFLQRTIGYCLTGNTDEQCFFIFYGIGANGKTVVQELFNTMLGNYSKHSPFTAFTRKYGNSSNDVARLQSARLVIASEGTDNRKFNEERIKELTGGGEITARYLFQEYFSFYPLFKLILAVNSLPKTDDFTDAFWRRIKIVPFNRQFKGTNADPGLLDNLKNELAGIINWALKGLSDWMEQGLNPPNEVKKAVDEYRSESDDVAYFIQEAVHIDDATSADHRISTSDLYTAYSEWYHIEYGKEPEMTQNTFTRRVRMVTGIHPVKRGKHRFFIGLTINDDE
ncbi:MAG: phage/plasmid primase, P4 family, partial [Candidatus Neomarinimicrobiota bacterium]